MTFSNKRYAKSHFLHFQLKPFKHKDNQLEDTQHNDTEHYDTQHKDPQHKVTQCNDQLTAAVDDSS